MGVLSTMHFGNTSQFDALIKGKFKRRWYWKNEEKEKIKRLAKTI